MSHAKKLLIYALHSGNLYGTERMALATAAGLKDTFSPVIFAPPGPALHEAQRLGMDVRSFKSPIEFAFRLIPYFLRHRELAFVATGVVHSLACLTLGSLLRNRVRHLHIVHGGTDEHLSYGRKRKLNGKPVEFVAVSQFVKEKLEAHGVASDQVTVVENFLPNTVVTAGPRRPAFGQHIRRILVVSRVDPIKRIDLLLDAMDRAHDLSDLRVTVLGTGWELDSLRERAAKNNPNVHFVGFSPQVLEEMAVSDLLLHLCGEEPFGLAIIEAMSVGLPVLVPDSGGAGSIVDHGSTGFRFCSNDVDSLVERLRELKGMSPAELNQVVSNARQLLDTRFSFANRLNDYRRLLEGSLNA